MAAQDAGTAGALYGDLPPNWYFSMVYDKHGTIIEGGDPLDSITPS